MKFRISLIAKAWVSACMEVDADTLEAAQAEALKQANEGNASWSYDGLSWSHDGVDNETIELDG